LRAWIMSALLLVAVTVATAFVQPALFGSLARRPWAWPFALVVPAAFAAAMWAWRGRRDRASFFGSAAFLVGLLFATAAALFPVMLRSTVAATYDVTAYGAATGRRGLLLGLTWWIPALLLAVAYFAYLFRSFAGKVRELHY
jgi:cytochrome d ubiquinol oxidase subunit II